jgi:L-lactate dehydrogenase complex protein LldG
VNAREVELERVRSALAGSSAPTRIPREYAHAGSAGRDAVVVAFVDRVEDYRGSVIRSGDAGAAVGRVLAEQGARRVAVPPDLPDRLRPPDVELVPDGGLSPQELDALEGVVTTCAAACAVTGTIALDGGPGQGRRALTLLPDLHVCVVREEQIVESVPELIRRLEPAAVEGRPILLVSGPSATSDIELQRVEGVHGPRRLVVILEP